MKKLTISVYFDNDAHVRDWILNGLSSLPDAFKVDYFGDGERPKKKRQFEVTNRTSFREYFEKCEYHGGLFGTGFWIDIGSFDSSNTVVTVYTSNRLKAHEGDIVELLSYFGSYHAVYARACTWEEYRRRNGWEIAFSYSDKDNDRKAEGWHGRAFHRYVPGLYWMNFFSNEYTKKIGLDLELVSSQLGIELIKTKAGTIVQICDKPEHWKKKDPEITRFLHDTQCFFSKERLDIPEAMHFSEMMRYTARLKALWP